MAVASYTSLQDFIDSLDVKDREAESEVEERVDEGVDVHTEESRRDDIWQSVVDSANDWSRRLVDVECLHSRSTNFRSTVDSSLYRMQLDGFLSIHEASELRYIADLWVTLLDSLSSHRVGCKILKRNLVSLLLKLYSTNQLPEELFIEVCLKL